MGSQLKKDMLRIVSYIFILISLFSCQRNVYDFERSEIVINNQPFEILTAYDIFDNFIVKKSNYSYNVFNQIKREFEHNAEYPFLFELIKKEIKPDTHLKEELELLKDIDFVQIVTSTFRKVTKKFHMAVFIQ